MFKNKIDKTYVAIVNKENDDLKLRIKELEDILCPFNKHDYVIIDTYTDNYISCEDVYYYTVRILQCKRCKKIVKDNDRYGFKYQITE